MIPQSLPGTWKTIPKLMFGRGRPLSIHPSAMLQMIPWGLQFLRQGRAEKVRRTAGAMSHLCGPSIELYERHLRGTGQEALITNAMYVHAFRDGSRASLDALDYRIRTEMGGDLELVGKDQLSRIEPALSHEFQAAILIKGQARIRSPGRLGEVLAAKAQAMGAEVKRAPIRRVIRKEGGQWEVVCDGETLRASQIILSMGAWTPALLRDLGLKVPLMAERGYHVEFSDPGIVVENSVMDVDARSWRAIWKAACGLRAKQNSRPSMPRRPRAASGSWSMWPRRSFPICEPAPGGFGWAAARPSPTACLRSALCLGIRGFSPISGIRIMG